MQKGLESRGLFFIPARGPVGGRRGVWHQEGLLYVLWCILNDPLVHLCRVTGMSAATCGPSQMVLLGLPGSSSLYPSGVGGRTVDGWLKSASTVCANPAKGAPCRCLVWDSVQSLVPKVLPPLLDSGLSQ